MKLPEGKNPKQALLPSPALPLECSGEINSLGKRLPGVYAKHHFLGTLVRTEQTQGCIFKLRDQARDSSLSHCGYSTDTDKNLLEKKS